MKKFFISAFISVLAGSLSAQSLVSDQTAIDFGTVAYGAKDSVLVTLENTTSQDVTVEEFRFFTQFNSQPFYTNTETLLIPAGGTNEFYVVFEPVHNIAHNSELVIYDNGGLGSIAIDLHGSGQYLNSYYNGTYNLSDVALKNALKTIISAGYQSHSYNEARDEMFMVIDNKKVNGQGASVNTLTRAYLGTDAVGYTSRSDAQSSFNLNTEHTWPQGFFDQNLPMRSDLHHLFVTDVNANAVRENIQFGEVVSNVIWSEGGSKKGSDQYGTTVFEPRDGHKGKTARGVLYFVIRYQNYGSYLALNQENILTEWNKEFLPTEQEVVRNDMVQDFQNNRNPFADYPQFADRIYRFGLDINRPALAEVEMSHNSITFNGVAETAVFNLVLTNKGNSAAAIGNFALSGPDNVFSLSDDLPGAVMLEAGESFSIPVSASASAQMESGTLSFIIDAGGEVQNIEIPLLIDESTAVPAYAAAALSVYPVPAFDHITITGAEDTDSYSSYQISDISGRTVAAGALNCDNNCEINVQELPAGMYLLSVFGESRHTRQTTKIVIRN